MCLDLLAIQAVPPVLARERVLLQGCSSFLRPNSPVPISKSLGWVFTSGQSQAKVTFERCRLYYLCTWTAFKKLHFKTALRVEHFVYAVEKNVRERERSAHCSLWCVCTPFILLHKEKHLFPGSEPENGKSGSIRTNFEKLYIICNKPRGSRSSGSKVTCRMS